jgi:hypothetical protein
MLIREEPRRPRRATAASSLYLSFYGPISETSGKEKHFPEVPGIMIAASRDFHVYKLFCEKDF